MITSSYSSTISKENLTTVVDFLLTDALPHKQKKRVLKTVATKYSQNFVEVLSAQYSWTTLSLKQFCDQLNWTSLSKNNDLFSITNYSADQLSGLYYINAYFSCDQPTEQTFWTVELLDTFIDYWDWMNLSSNPGLPWDENFIEKYKDKWNWMNIAGNTTLPWNEQLIEKFKSELEGQMYDMYDLSNRHSKVSNETELFVTKNKTNYHEYHILRLIQRKILNNTVRINNNKSIHITNKDELLINSLIEVFKNEKDWKVIGFFVANEQTNLWDLSFNRSLLCDYIDLNLIDEILN